MSARKFYKLSAILLGIISIFLYTLNTSSQNNYLTLNDSFTSLNTKYNTLNDSFTELKNEYAQMNKSYDSAINAYAILNTSGSTIAKTENNVTIININDNITFNETDKLIFNIKPTGYESFLWTSTQDNTTYENNTYVYINVTIKNAGLRQSIFNISRVFPNSYFKVKEGYEYDINYINSEFLNQEEEKKFVFATQIPGNMSPSELVLNTTTGQQIWINITK